eukprot:TRINITY_DN14234_c2_g1_i1.p1 TRINITY_DN14234_c2_g1~~TRINITY_DN14234_c2_g1_i1.p1  ORF type:complete len:429 (+),score=61.41 TRINITY_DN14234_c2_g1_i1:66-1352(+)
MDGLVARPAVASSEGAGAAPSGRLLPWTHDADGGSGGAGGSAADAPAMTRTVLEGSPSTVPIVSPPLPPPADGPSERPLLPLAGRCSEAAMGSAPATRAAGGAVAAPPEPLVVAGVTDSRAPVAVVETASGGVKRDASHGKGGAEEPAAVRPRLGDGSGGGGCRDPSALESRGAPLTSAAPPSRAPLRPEASSAGEKVVWEFSVQKGFEPFASESQALVEHQYQLFRSGTGAKVGRIESGGRTILLDFVSMQQHVEGSTRKRGLQRRCVGVGIGGRDGSAPAAAASSRGAAADSRPSAAGASSGGGRALAAPEAAPRGRTEPAKAPGPGRAGPTDGVGGPGAGGRPGAEAALAACDVVWEFSVRDGFKPFDKAVGILAEKHYQAFLSGGPSSAKVPSGGITLVLDYKAMRQKVEGSARLREVRRRKVP